MTGKNRNTMYPGEKKNRASKTALLNLSFSRAVRLPFAIILLCDRVETNSINPVSQGKVTGQKPCIHAGLRRFDGHSHSILAGGLVVTSSTTRFTCGTSLTILAEIVRTTSYGMRAQSAVMKSSVVTARMATV